MRIGIIGAGYTGLSAAYHLAQKGHQVIVFEKEKYVGGLAAGFKAPRWKWKLEIFYHHLFPSDTAILNLIKEIEHPLLRLQPKTSIYFQNHVFPFDSPTSLLKFPHLSIFSKIRTGLVLAFLKLNIFWQPLEKISAARFLKSLAGTESWHRLWHPLFKAKFGRYLNLIPASWFWARIKKRGNKFLYPQGGFALLAESIKKASEKMGAQYLLATEVKELKKNLDGRLKLKTTRNTTYNFDRIIFTLPYNLLPKIVRNLPADYRKRITKLKNLGAVNLILSLKRQFLIDNTYWLNLNDHQFPFVGIVEHTNFIPSRYYGHNHLVYITNYLEPKHPNYQASGRVLLQKFLPYLQKINPDFRFNWVNQFWVTKSPMAQPIITLNYSQKIVNAQTPIAGLSIVNMQQIIPWDRQTNYAVAAGKEIAGQKDPKV